jgi:hypothetical protein
MPKRYTERNTRAATDLPKDVVKREFARRLQAGFVDMGLNASEFARRVEAEVKKTDPEGRFGRDLVSNYIRGRSLPGPVYLQAMAKTLRMEPNDLLPARGVGAAAAVAIPPMEMRELDDGNVFLRVNQVTDYMTAMRIMQLLKGVKDTNNHAGG